MKSLLLIFFACCFSFCLQAQTINPNFNKALADSLGADDFGMKSYMLVILKTGSNKTENKEKVAQLFRGHLNNISRLASEGKLVVAGPLGANDNNYRGIYIFNVKTKAEAQALLQTDPAVKAKLLDAEIYEWYGSAALPVYQQTHQQIFKQSP